jgi:large subunit ribosomal protein L23
MAVNVLIKPIITEKSTKLSENKHTYAFRVDREANKIEIKKAVEKAYSVNVEAVNTSVTPGKKKVRYTKRGLASGMKSAYKKAYVTLKTGESIDFYGAV